MAKIKDEQIEAARSITISDVWLRLGLPAVRAGTAFSSPFREDKKPSCQLGGEKNIFFDHATGESLDTIALTRKVKGCGFVEAVAFVLDRTPEELLGNNGSHAHPSPARVVDAIEELAKVRGWKPEALHALGALAKNAQGRQTARRTERDPAIHTGGRKDRR